MIKIPYGMYKASFICSILIHDILKSFTIVKALHDGSEEAEVH